MNFDNKQHGFTIIELVITMVVSSVIIVSLVGTVTVLITNTALLGTRNGLPTDLQTGLQKLAGIVRNSDNVLLYNLALDNNAPTVKAGESANVPGPIEIPADDDHRYFWRSTSKQLVLAQPSRAANGKPIYTDAVNGDFTGPRDSIVLYIKDKALYQRTVHDSASASVTAACGTTSTTGGCPSDVKLVDNIKLVGGVPQITFIYLDSAGVEISATMPNGNNNYQARKLTRAIKIDLTLEVTVGTKTVDAHDVSTISFRKDFIPGVTFNNLGTGNAGTAPPYSMSGMYIGPGGLEMPSIGTGLTGSGLNVMGKITLNTYSNIGSSSAPMNVFVGNKACGTPPNWPISCAPAEPIPGLAGYGNGGIYGNICATNQVTTAKLYSPGLQVGCLSPPIEMPTYDRQAFMDSMKEQQSPNNASCSGINLGVRTLSPDTEYMGNVELGAIFCRLIIKGNVHIMGDLTVGSLTSLYVDDSAGTKRPIVLVDGNITMAFGNSVVPNSYGTGIDFISMKSSNANCLTTPACRDRTDMSLLYNSYKTTTISLSFVPAAGSTFYSYYGGVRLGFGTNVGNISGQTVIMDGFTSANGT